MCSSCARPKIAVLGACHTISLGPWCCVARRAPSCPTVPRRAPLQVTDALRHVPHCMEYMGEVRNTAIFRFCAIPQIMAIGTLAICYNNGKLFEGG